MFHVKHKHRGVAFSNNKNGMHTLWRFPGTR